MDILKILSILYGANVEERSEQPREIFADFHKCGQLGSEDKKECTWNCDWRNSTTDGLSDEDVSNYVQEKIISVGN